MAPPSSKDSIAPGLPGPATSALHRLLPLLLILVLLGAMIAGGIARNRARVRTAVAHHSGTPKLDVYCNSVAGFLAARQNIDGSWAGYRSASPAFDRSEPIDNVASTMRILLNVKGSVFQRQDFYQKGLYFVRRSQRQPGIWQDLESTVMGWLLLSGELEPSTALALFLRDRETSDGLFREGVPGASGDTATAASSAAQPLFRSNLLLLGGLPQMRVGAVSLEGTIRRHLREPEPRRTASWPVLAYLVGLSADAGSTAAAALLETDFSDRLADVRQRPWVQHDSVSLAAYLTLHVEHCLRSGNPCADANAPAGGLITRMRGGGKFEAAPFAWSDANKGVGDPGQSYIGSAAETASFALKALVTYRRLLEARAAPGAQSAGR